MAVHVLLFDAGVHGEGIHSLVLNGKTIVLLFEDADDAKRYAELLEAQDFPSPTVEEIPQEDVEHFCRCNGYEARVVPKGLRPHSEEELLLLLPPERNLDVEHWHEQPKPQDSEPQAGAQDHEEPSLDGESDLEDFRRKLERLI